MKSFWDSLFGIEPSDPVKRRVEKEMERLRRIDEALEGPYGGNAALYATTTQLIKDANFPTTDRFAARVIRHFCDRCDEKGITQPHDAILRGMALAAASIYAVEMLAPNVLASHKLPDPTPYGYGVGAGQLRDLLLLQQQKAANATATLDGIRDALTTSFLAIARRLPGVATDGPIIDGVPTIPYIDLLPRFGTLVEEVLAPFVEPNELGLFRWIQGQIKQNSDRLVARLHSKRPIPPSEFDGSPQEVLDAYIGETAFRHMFDVRIPFDISLEDRGEHTAIIAGSGWGKTQLLQSIIADDLERDDPPAIVVIDSTGAMVQRIQHLAIFNEHLKDRLLIIDPERDPVPALNPFDIRNSRFATYDQGQRERVQEEIINLFSYVFSSVNNPLTSRMQTAFAFMTRLLLSIPGANIHTLLELLDDSPPKGNYERAVFRPHIDKLDQTARHFFRSQYYTGSSDQLREQIRARVFDILKVPAFERMFSTVNRVDFYTELNNGSIVLVNTSENLLREGSATFGRYIIARVVAAAFERSSLPPEKRRQAFLIVDEAAPYFDEQFEKLLNRVRQFKLGAVIAFQNLEQASDKLRPTIASSTAIKYAGGTGANDARWLAAQMRCDPEFIMSQKRDVRPPKWTQFACYVRGYTDRAVSLTVPFFTLENMPRMTDAEHAQLLQRNSARVSAPRKPEPLPPAEASPEQATVETLGPARPADVASAVERDLTTTADPMPPQPSSEVRPPQGEEPRGDSEGATDWH